MTSKAFKCKNCKLVLGERRANTLIAKPFDVEFKFKHRIKCHECEGYTVFSITRPPKLLTKCSKAHNL